MMIKIEEVSEEGLQLPLTERSVTLRRDGLSMEGPLTGKLFLTKQGERNLHIEGTLSAPVRLTCSRCLNTFLYPLESDFGLDAAPLIQRPVGEAHHLHQEELNVHFYRGDSLSIEEIIENQILLEIPMAPLCQPDCQGLCPFCGANFNNGPHTCLKKEASL